MNKSKGLIVQYLEDYFGRQTIISSINIIPPFRLEIDDLRVGDLFSARRVIISPSLVGMLLGRVAFNDIVLIEPQVVLKRTKEGKFDLGLTDAPGEETDAAKPQFKAKTQNKTANSDKIKERVKKRLIIIGDLYVKDGKLSFTDSKVSKKGFSITISDIDIIASKLSLSVLPTPINFTVKAKIFTSEENKASIDFSGWVNLFKRNMEAKFNLTNFDLTFLAPYYSAVTNSQVKSGFLSAEADVNSKNNNLNVKCRLSVKDFLFKEPVKEQENEGSMISALSPFIFSFFDTKGGHPQEFTLEGKLYPFRIEKVNFNCFIAKDKVQDLFSSEPQELIEKVKEAGGKIFGELGKPAEEEMIFEEQDRVTEGNIQVAE